MGRPYTSPNEPLGEICVGFNRGNLSKGIIFVDKPDKIKVNPPEALMAAKLFEKIV